MNRNKSNSSSRRRGSNRVPTLVRLDRRLNSSSSSNQIYPQTLRFNGTISSSVGGQITTAILMNPNGSSDWAALAGLYDEFRVLAVRIDLTSLQQFSVTSANGHGGFAYDNDDSTMLASLSALTAYNTVKLVPAVFAHVQNQQSNKSPCLTLEWARPNSGSNTAILWNDCGIPGNSLGSIKTYWTGLSVSTAYFGYTVTWFTEFRGRR